MMVKDIHTRLEELLASVTQELVHEIIVIGATVPEANFLSGDLADLNLFEQICFDLQRDGLTPPVSDFVNSMIADKALKLDEEQEAVFNDESLGLKHQELNVIKTYFYDYCWNYSNWKLEYYLDKFAYLESDTSCC
ncbi:hypothetical protein [Dysgonomonas massiliensis]|uniref:hypothetical protein n=1 Tax=Dysgonomonas massiliensis TaxID=2040292 RepID=UPI000C7583EB|nr:hypothetical protein [Dysgonomonas massiliensis]